MSIATATITVKNADWVIAFVDDKLSEVSYGKVVNGYVEIPLDFNHAVTVLTSAVCHLVIKHFKGERYSDVSIILKNGIKTLRMKSPLYD